MLASDTLVSDGDLDMPKRGTLAPDLIRDYDLFQLSVPHHDALQELVGTEIAAFAREMRELTRINVLEIGTGTGITTSIILQADPRVNVVSIDIEPAMAAHARQLLRRQRDRLRVEAADMWDVLRQTPDASFDVVATAFTLHHVAPEQWPSFAVELARILKPGGLFVNADKIAQTDPHLHKADLDAQLAAFRIFDKMNRPDLRAQWTKHYLADDRNKLDEVEQLRNLQHAGFAAYTIWRKRMEAVVVGRLER